VTLSDAARVTPMCWAVIVAVALPPARVRITNVAVRLPDAT
jgi:hypothetical protein